MMLRVNLCGIMYRVSETGDGGLCFTEEAGVAFNPGKFFLSKSGGELWRFEKARGCGFGDSVPCCHIQKAYAWATERYGADHEAFKKV